MPNWTLTPDGLKTDDQLWLDDFLINNPHCPRGCAPPLVRAGRWEVCLMLDNHVGIWVGCGQPALISCTHCGTAWCKKHLEP